MRAMVKLGFALICVFCLPVLSQSANAYFSYYDLVGVQDLWAAWNTSTPNHDINLKGWHSARGDNTDYPCWNQKANWRGVECLRYTSNYTSFDSNTWIIALSLTNASIGGILPSGVSNFYYLVTLTLTGNPGLTGPIPKELGGLPLNVLDLHDNNFNGTIPMELSSLNNLLELNLGGNQLTGPFPTHFGQTGTLQDYTISQNQFTGPIPQQAFENLTQLLTLDISSNQFTGLLPNLSMLNSLNKLNVSNNGFTKVNISTIFDGITIPKSIVVLDLSNLTIIGNQLNWRFLGNQSKVQQLFLDHNYINGTLDITSMSNLNLIPQRSSNGTSVGPLQKLSLKNNSITDVLSTPNLITDITTVFYLQGNPYCNYKSSQENDAMRCYCRQICLNLPIADNKSAYKLRVIIIATSISAGFLIVMLLVSIYLIHRSKQNLRYLMRKFEEAEVNPKRFDYNELRVATRNFHEDLKLGAGGFGAVYKAILPNNNVVAVKQLFLKTQEVIDSFINEVVLITNLQHRNLVNLKGFCVSGKEMLLVYEYVDNHDLDKILLNSTEGNWRVMNWAARFKICTGVAHGLYYLHASSTTKIIHRDIKASNILLDKDMNPKIADFGLARPFRTERSQITTEHHAGTIGYLAPEYMLYGQLSEKADVFSFGVLLLEIVSGKRNKDPSAREDDVYLPNRVWHLHKEDNLVALVDPKLHLNPDEEMEAKRVLEIALMCIQMSVEKRPTMFSVVSMLVGDSEILVNVDDSSTWLDLDYHPDRHLLEGGSTRNSSQLMSSSTSSHSPRRFRSKKHSMATLELSDLGGR